MNIKISKTSIILYCAILLFFGLISCQILNSNSDDIVVVKTQSVDMDLHTLSNYHQLPIVHTHLDLKVDFDHKILIGSVTHKLPDDRDIDVLTLDTKYLAIDSVVDQNGKQLKYSFGPYDDLFGEPISCLLYTSPSPRDRFLSRMPSSA